MTTTEEIWIRTDETQEFLDNIKHVSFLLNSVTSESSKWKWVILALHNTMEGLFTCHLRGHDTSGVNILTKKSAKEVSERLYDREGKLSQEKRPAERIASMLDLFKRVKNQNYLHQDNVLISSPNKDFSIKKLNILRNEYDHFIPKSWSLEISDLPCIIRDCCYIIEQLAIKRPTLHSRISDHKTIIVGFLSNIEEKTHEVEKEWKLRHQHSN